MTTQPQTPPDDKGFIKRRKYDDKLDWRALRPPQIIKPEPHISIHIDVPLHPAQQVVYDAINNNKSLRFAVLACGRRWGKSFLASALLAKFALTGGENGGPARVWWIAPNYRQSEVGWAMIKQVAKQIHAAGLKANVKVTDRMVEFEGGGEMWVKSAANPDTLRGQKLPFVVLDECAYIERRVWYEVIRPTLADGGGRAMLISTPFGTNWFKQAYELGSPDNADKLPEWQSWRFPTSTNPFIDPKELEMAKREMSARAYAQEFEAEFLGDSGGVFVGVSDAAEGNFEVDAPEPGHMYVFGIDWGRVNDYTAVVILDITTMQVAKVEKLRRTDYIIQIEIIKNLFRHWQPQAAVIEVNAAGQPLFEQLSRTEGIARLHPFYTDVHKKTRVVEAAALAIERGDLKLVRNPELISQLQSYTFTRTAHGNMRYSAPEGEHDDMVMALCLAYSGIHLRKRAQVMRLVKT